MSTQSQASGCITLRLIENGSTVSTYFESKIGTASTALYQIVDPETGAVIPSWEAANKPMTITVKAAYGSTTKTVTVDPTQTDQGWFINDVKITASNKDSFGVVGDSYKSPSLQLGKNLASADNTNNDVIRFSGMCKISDTQTIAVSHAATVEITSNADGVYLGVIDPAEAFLDASTTSKLFTATLYLGATEVKTYGVRWKVNGKYLNSAPAYNFSTKEWTNITSTQTALADIANNGTAGVDLRNNKCTVKRAQIEGQALLVAEFYIPKLNAVRTVERASAIVTDIADEFRVVLSSSCGESVPNGTTATVTAMIMKGDAQYTTAPKKWELKALNASTLASVVNKTYDSTTSPKVAATATIDVKSSDLSSAGGQVVVTALATL